MSQERNLEGFTFQYHWSKSKNVLYMLFVVFGTVIVCTAIAGVSHMLGSLFSIAFDPDNFNQWPPVGASSWLIVAGYASIILAIANIVRFRERTYTGTSDLVLGAGLILVPFLFAAIFQ